MSENLDGLKAVLGAIINGLDNQDDEPLNGEQMAAIRHALGHLFIKPLITMDVAVGETMLLEDAGLSVNSKWLGLLLDRLCALDDQEIDSLDET